MNVPPAEPGAEEVIARNPLLAFVLCRQEAFHRTAQEFRRRELECDTLPYLRHLGEIWPEDSAPGTPERVDFAKPLRKFAKARLPDYRLSIRDLTLSKALNADVEIRLVFNRSGRSGLGKKFDVHLRVHTPMPAGTTDPWADFFSLFDREHVHWTYHSQKDLDLALEAAFNLFSETLPALEAHCRSLLDPLPTRIPDNIPRRGALTARGGYEEARALASRSTGGSSLPLIRALASRMFWVERPTVGFRGELRVQSAWHYQFSWASKRRAAWVVIPSIGSARILFAGVHASFGTYRPVPDAWIDSDRALSVSEDIRQKHHGPEVEIRDILPSLEGPRSWDPFPTSEERLQPYWKIHYHPNHLVPNPEAPLIISVNAVTGEPVDAGGL